MYSRLKIIRGFNEFFVATVQLSTKYVGHGKHVNYYYASNGKSWHYLRKAEHYANTTFRGHNHLITLLNGNADKEMSNLDTHLDVIDHLIQKLGSTNTNWPPSLYYTNFVQFLNSTTKSFKYISKNDMLLLLSVLSNVKLSEESQLVRSLDTECARRALMWSADTCLLVLDLWVILVGHKIVQSAFWKVLLKHWTFINGCNKPQNAVQLLFYIGLFKCASQHLMPTLENYLEKAVGFLTDDDVLIVCQGFFKTKHKIQSMSILRNITQRIVQMSTLQQFDEMTFISYIKVLRHARYEDVNLCHQVVNFIKSSINFKTNLMHCAHFSAFFASNRFYDVQLFSEFEASLCNACNAELSTIAKLNDFALDMSENEIKTSHLSNLSRMKDISRILWSMSELVHSPTQYFSEVITKYLRLRIQKDFNNLEKAYYIDCVHSLSIMGVLLNDLVEKYGTESHESR